MKKFQSLNLEIKDGVARLLLNRPEKHNALNALMIGELRQAAQSLKQDDSVRVVVLAARGKSFCAGGDLNWMKQQRNQDRAEKIKQSTELAMMLRDLDQLPKPLIGRIQGAAYGGGIGMISVCDIAIGSENARFALTETRLGLIPATIGPYVVRRLGESHARQVFMSGAGFDANQAVKMGLLSKSVKESDLDRAVDSYTCEFLKCAPGAVSDAKELCLKLARNPEPDDLEYTANKLADRWETNEAQQGIDAFFSKSIPPWTK